MKTQHSKNPVFHTLLFSFGLGLPLLAQTDSSVGFTITPPNQSAPVQKVEMTVSEPTTPYFRLKNPIGSIEMVVPQITANGPNTGSFSVSKTVNGGTPITMLDLLPGSSANTLNIAANTTITGSLTISGGGLVLPNGGGLSSPYSGAALIGGTSGTTVGAANAVAIGGAANKAMGVGAVVIGGANTVSFGEENLAQGNGSTIIGSIASKVLSPFASVIGGAACQILGPNSHYSTLLGGNNNTMQANAGNYNAILGGSYNQFISGGYESAIIAGSSNKIDGGSSWQVIVGGYSNTVKFSVNSAIVGGKYNIVNDSPGDGGGSFVGGGQNNIIQPGASLCTVLGGASNSANGWSNTVIGAANSSTEANTSYSTVMGQFSKSTGNYQLVTGFANVPDSTKLFIVGNGTGNDNRSNAFTVDTAGNATAKTSVTTPQLILTTPPDTSDISMGPFTQGAP